MNRRGFLLRAVGSAGACGGLAGCADLSVGGGGRVATERDPPDRPDELAPESVAEYVAAYEEVHAHNRYAAEGAVEVTVDADASIDHASGNDHYATAQHAGSVSHEHDDGARSVGEVYADPVPYLVTPDRTLRMAVERRAVEADVQNGDGGDDTAPDDERTSFPLGVRLLNVTEEARELTLTVTRRVMADGSRADGETVTDLDIAIEPGTAVEARSITDVRGGYRITARTENNGVTGEGRIQAGLPSVDRGPNVDVVLDGSGVSTWLLPPFEGI